MAYARKLTKEDLQRSGITNITEDGRVFRQGLEIPLNINTSGYFTLWIYDTDEEGNYIKCKLNTSDYYYYKQRTIGLHRAMWAWYYGEVPQGYVVDHINNRHESIEDYHLSNLQLLTPKENLSKDKTNWHISQRKCQMSKPRSFYEEKLARYLEAYEEAKRAQDADLCHKLRSSISQTRARLRYWDSHKNEYEAHADQAIASSIDRANKKQSVRDRKLLKQFKDEARAKGNLRKWHYLNSVIKNWDKYDATVKHNIMSVLLGRVTDVI